MMKSIAVVALLLFASPAVADCSAAADFAAKVMAQRQQGVQPDVLLERLTSRVSAIKISREQKAQMRDWLKLSVSEAYLVPRYRTAKDQQRAVQNFRSNAYIGCINR